ncbi:hypothetical protein HDU80_000583 [Chytriomyces hyalinus]|nr:hypothetical protein HDU80_000583 [Chytriomyces hyalinus]
MPTPGRESRQNPWHYAGCFEGKRDTKIASFHIPVSNISDCASFCPTSAHDDPFFMMLYPDDTLAQHCGCSTMCTLAQVGETLARVSDSSCDLLCPSGEQMCGGLDATSTYLAVYSISPLSISCSEREITLPLNRATQILCCSALGINVLQCLFLLYYVKKEMGVFTTKAWIKHLATPFNFQLLTMALSLITVFICLVIETMHLDLVVVQILPFNCFLVATFKSCFLLYSWGRGSAVISSVWSDGLKYFRAFIYGSPILLYSVVIPAAIFVNLDRSNPQLTATTGDALFIIDTAGTVAIFAVDFGLLVCFSIHIRRNTRVSATDPVSPRFLRICYYGIVANLLCISAFILQIYRILTNNERLKNPLPQYTFDAVMYTIFTAVQAVLLGLKVSLQRQNEREAKVKLSVHERAIAIAHGKLFDSDVGRFATSSA